MTAADIPYVIIVLLVVALLVVCALGVVTLWQSRANRRGEPK